MRVVREGPIKIVRRQNNWLRLQLKLEEFRPRLWVDVILVQKR